MNQKAQTLFSKANAFKLRFLFFDVDNRDVSKVLTLIADLLEAHGENRFKIRAYRNVAQSVDTLDGDINALRKEGKLRSIPGVGKAIEEKITEYLTTGRLVYIDDLKKNAPSEFELLMQVETLGPKKVMRLFKELKIDTLRGLEDAAVSNKIRNLPGFGEKSETKILRALATLRPNLQRTPLKEAQKISEKILRLIRRKPEVSKAEAAGSFRRKKATVGDLDILVVSGDPKKTMDFFAAMPKVLAVIGKGEKKTSVRLESGLQVDLRVVQPGQWGAALLYFTGSKAHNIELRKNARRRGWKLNEYGLFDGKGRVIASKTEKDIYTALGHPYLPPEKREE